MTRLCLPLPVLFSKYATQHVFRPIIFSCLIISFVLAFAEVATAKLRKYVLSGSTPTLGSVNCYFEISPDGRKVVYRADQHSDSMYELFGVYDDPHYTGILPLMLPAILSGTVQ